MVSKEVEELISKLGPPDIEVKGFRFWIDRKLKLGNSRDMISGIAHCETSKARVWTDYPAVLAHSVQEFVEACDRIWKGKSKEASLCSIEQDLSLRVEVTDSLGHLGFKVQITPDYIAQSHTFNFQIDQSYLPNLIKQCETICEKYSPPTRG